MKTPKRIINWQKNNKSKHICISCKRKAKLKKDGSFYNRCEYHVEEDRRKSLERYYTLKEVVNYFKNKESKK